MKNKLRAKKFYSDFLMKELRDIQFATEYLNAALEEKNNHSFLIAVRNVAKAHDIPMGKLAQKTQINRVNIYKMLSKKGNPLLINVKRILEVLGFKISITTRLLEH